MTSRERVLRALRREAVDRTPVLEMAIDWKVMRGLGYRRYLEMIEGLDLDAVSVNQMLYHMGWRKFVLPFVNHYTDEWGVRSRPAGEILPVPVGHPLSDPAALENFRPPDPTRSPLLGAIRYVRRRVTAVRAAAGACGRKRPDRASATVGRQGRAGG